MRLHLPVVALLVQTAGTGLVDAVSYLGLGHVFVANMTGNIVFLGFAANRNSGLSASLALIALTTFMFGAAVGGTLGHRLAASRVWPSSVLGAHSAKAGRRAALVLGGTATACAVLHIQAIGRPTIVALLAFAFGLQNSTARRIAVPDLTTTVLTLTVTGLAADSRIASGPGAHPVRRTASITAMLAGAAAGALLVQVAVAATVAAVALCALSAAIMFSAAPAVPQPG